MAGCAKTIQINLGGMTVAELLESFVKIPIAIKTQILFSYPSIVTYGPEEENRQLEKLYYQVGLLYSPNATVNFRQVVSSAMEGQPPSWQSD